jgi:hypothetical protein
MLIEPKEHNIIANHHIIESSLNNIVTQIYFRNPHPAVSYHAPNRFLAVSWLSPTDCFALSASNTTRYEIPPVSPLCRYGHLCPVWLVEGVLSLSLFFFFFLIYNTIILPHPNMAFNGGIGYTGSQGVRANSLTVNDLRRFGR